MLQSSPFFITAFSPERDSLIATYVWWEPSASCFVTYEVLSGFRGTEFYEVSVLNSVTSL